MRIVKTVNSEGLLYIWPKSTIECATDLFGNRQFLKCSILVASLLSFQFNSFPELEKNKCCNDMWRHLLTTPHLIQMLIVQHIGDVAVSICHVQKVERALKWCRQNLFDNLIGIWVRQGFVDCRIRRWLNRQFRHFLGWIDSSRTNIWRKNMRNVETQTGRNSQNF